jgi:para-aminobenzoate synthetase component 1
VSARLRAGSEPLEVPFPLPTTRLLAAFGRGRPRFLLESADDPAAGYDLPAGRWTIMGAATGRPFTVRVGRIHSRTGRGGPLAALHRFLAPLRGARAHDGLPFHGGAVGYLGYGFNRAIENVARHRGGALGLPDALLYPVHSAVVLDGLRGEAYATAVGESAAEVRRRLGDLRARIEGAVRAAPPRPPRSPHAHAPHADVKVPRSSLGRRGYEARVRRIVERIRAGEVFQVCLADRFEEPFRGDPLALYEELLAISPSPFAAYLEVPGGALVMASPERFLHLSADGTVESRPIKGTRARKPALQDDARMAIDLERSAKDRAENVMIVDLVRNDLGRVCKTGSVRVARLCALEEHPTVWHLVSTVRGELQRGRDAVDLIAAAFPGGSMTGAPKVQAMKVIADLEKVERGPYAGGLGYFDASGALDLAMTIRCVLVRRGRAVLWAGGGITADSDPAEEWREALAKAAAPARALAAAGAR